MWDQIVTPNLFNGVGVGAVLVLLLWMLATGRLCTGRELREKNSRIEALEKALHTRDEQVSAALAVLPRNVAVLEKFHDAAEQVRGQGGDQ